MDNLTLWNKADQWNIPISYMHHIYIYIIYMYVCGLLIMYMECSSNFGKIPGSARSCKLGYVRPSSWVYPPQIQSFTQLY